MTKHSLANEIFVGTSDGKVFEYNLPGGSL
jgi:hypothetical protein